MRLFLSITAYFSAVFFLSLYGVSQVKGEEPASLDSALSDPSAVLERKTSLEKSLPIDDHLGEQVHVKVSGMVCDSCSQSLRRSFGKFKEVEKIDVSLEPQNVQIFIKSGSNLSDQQINEAIESQGISVEEISR